MALKKRDETNYIIIHCSATPPSMNVTAKDIDRWHRDFGWLGIGYHAVIRRDGSIEYGRNHDVPGAHVKGYNHESIGICMAGGVSESDRSAEDNFTDAQYESLHWLAKVFKDLYPEAEIVGHRDMPGVAKACPSFDVQEKLVADLEDWQWDG